MNGIKRLALAMGICLATTALVSSANAASLRQGSTGGGANVTGSLPGQVLWGYYLTTERGIECYDNTVVPVNYLCNTEGEGDNILRLVNPNGSSNPFLAGGIEHPVCAMIYVFDDDEEMGECCGCLLSSNKLATFSVKENLTSNWGLQGGPEGGAHGNGSIAIVAAGPNGPGGTISCDPTNVPGYPVVPENNLLGSITHNSVVAPDAGGLTEVGLFDNGGGDPTNLTYLQTQCGALIGNGSHGGVCTCPNEQLVPID